MDIDVIKIEESPAGKIYYARSDGTFFVKYKSGKTRELKCYPYLKKKKKFRDAVILRVKIGCRDYDAKNVIAKAFLNVNPGDTVVCIDKDPTNIAVDNLKVFKKSTYAKLTGALSRRKKVALCDENGNIINTFPSARRAGKELGCSYQTICDICNNKSRRKMFNVRWVS